MAQTQDFQGNWSIRPQMILPFISPRSNRISRASLSLNQTMRELWEQHDVWTRLTIESIVFRLPDERFVISRLLRNPEDFAQALRPFYGGGSPASLPYSSQTILSSQRSWCRLLRPVMHGGLPN